MQNTEKIIGIVMLSVTVLKLPLNKIVYIILIIWLIFCINSFSLLWYLKEIPLFSKSKFLLLLFFMEILKVIQLIPRTSWLSIYNLLHEIKQQIIFSLFFHKQGLCKAIKRGRCWWRLICFSWCFIKCEFLKNIQKKIVWDIHLTFIGLVT